MGCEKAKGEFLVIVSAHVYPVHCDWLEKILLPFSKEDVGLVYGKQRGNDATKFSEHQIFYNWFLDKSNWNQSHPFCNNANAVVRKEVWQKLKYDENLTGLEDLSFAKYLISDGYKIAYEAEAEVIHVHNENASNIYNRYFREAIAMKEIFPQQKFSVFDFFHLYIKNSIADTCEALKEHSLLKNIYWIFLFRLMQFLGTYKGSNSHGIISWKLKEKFYYPNKIASKKDKSLYDSSDRSIIDYTEFDKQKYDENY